MLSLTSVIAINCECILIMEDKNSIIDANHLYQAYLKSREGSAWKPQVQDYRSHYLLEIVKVQKELKDQTYKSHKGSEFIIHERGKIRYIRSSPFYDRVVRRDLCDNILIPRLTKYLIHDNGASVKGKGISFTRRRFEQHLHEYYRKFGNNGYILLIDFSKYYDNIRHDKLKEKISKHITDDYTLWLLDVILDNFKVDVSYMTDEEYNNCMNDKFDSNAYQSIDKSKLTKEKFMHKSCGIGDQTSQIASIFFPTRIDNYCKIVKGIRGYGRYMDDTYIISNDKEFLHKIVKEISEIAKDMGIFINEKKTRICRLDQYFTWLQMRYRLTDSGHLIIKINPKRVTAERRRLKKLAKKVDNGEIPYKMVENSYKSWIGNYHKYMSNQQLKHMNDLYNELFIDPFLKGEYYNGGNSNLSKGRC